MPTCKVFLLKANMQVAEEHITLAQDSELDHAFHANMQVAG
jgi:hypothetical protein